MSRNVMVSIMILVSLLSINTKHATKAKTSPIKKEGKAVTLTIAYDNYKYDPHLKPAWGFSCLVQGLEKTVLFDTGGRGEILLANLEKLNIDIQDIDLVFLSHIHGDHTGGLSDLLEKKSNLFVYLPEAFPDKFKQEVEERGAKIVEVKSSMMIFNNAYSTGQLGTGIKEQSLIVKTKKGLVLITGCAHPGIVNIVRKAKKINGGEVYLVLGGFHLSGVSVAGVKKIIEQFRSERVQKVGPCHCSGDRTRELLKEAYGEDFIEVGVGKLIEIGE